MASVLSCIHGLAIAGGRLAEVMSWQGRTQISTKAQAPMNFLHGFDVKKLVNIAIAQGANIVRRELGLPATYVPAADPQLQIDVVPGRNVAAARVV